MAAVKSKKSTQKLKAGKKKGINRWLIVGGVAAVAVVGAAVVRFSSASTYTFVHYASKGQVSGSKIRTSSAHKQLTSRPSTIVSSASLKYAKKVCAHFKTFGSGPWGRIKIEHRVPDKGYTSGYRVASSSWIDWTNGIKSGNVCTPVRSRVNSSVSVDWISMGGSNIPEIGIDTIYGVK